MKKILFVLPMPARKPIGGYKIIYEYADRLAENYDVSIFYSILLPHVQYKLPFIMRLLGAFYILKSNRYKWYKFQRKVKQKVIWGISDKSIPVSDVIIATAWSTAQPINDLDYSKGDRYYLIQGYETWCGSDELLARTYKLGLKNIVISRWLEKKVKSLGGSVYARIPNGIDLKHFQLKNDIDKRNPLKILMMYHDIESKGGKDGIKVLEKVKMKYKDLSVTLFGVVPRGGTISSWIHYVHNPSVESLVELYNSHSIFLSTSWCEGFGLTGAEAMACGCALVTTDNGGCRDYALHNETALVSEPRNIDSLVENVEILLQDNSLRIAIAENGNRYIKQFSWENSIARLEKKIINKCLL